MTHRSIDSRATGLLTTLVLCWCLLLLGASAASAVDHYVFGQVFAVSSEDAADTAIADADLTGTPMRYPHVQVYDLGSGALLGEADAGENGQFTVRFDLPAGATPDVECRVYRVVDGDAQLFPAAREGINSFSSIGAFTSVGLRVVDDSLLEYGATGLVPYPGVGLVFTRVGKVEIPFISQDITAPNLAVAGLADFTSDFSRADELHVPRFVQAPFSRGLLVFGDFGLPGGACAGRQIDWYRVTIEKLAEPTSTDTYSFVLHDPLSKIRTQVTTSPTLSVTHHNVKVGPIDGFLDGPLPGPDAGTPVDALYWVNRNQVGGLTSTFYSFPDLRLNWVSNSRNGLFRVTVTYYEELGRTPDDAPILDELPASCFTGAPPSTSTGGVHQLIVRVNNQDLTTRFDHIYLRNPGTGMFLGPSGPVASEASAIDFNAEGLCDILELQSTYQVDIRFTVEQAGGYLRSYTLHARSNDGSSTVTFAQDDFTSHTTATNPLWSGPGSTGAIRGGFSRCGYDFDLVARSRLQNGYNYVQWRNPERVYYVEP